MSTTKRPSRGRAQTFTGAITGFFSPFKGGVKPTTVSETIGWRPNTLGRNTSGLSQHHVLGSPPVVRFEAAPNLKRQLSSGSRKDQGAASREIPTVDVTEVASPGAQSWSSSNSSQRIAFVPQLLKPTDSSKSGNKVRQRAPSPYPGLKQLPPITKLKEAIRGEPLIRSRTRTLTMERMDGGNSLHQYLETHPDDLPPPGSTPAFVQQYWHLRRQSSDSSLSDPEADDEASDFSDAESENNDPCRWDTETAFDSDDEYEHELAPRPPRRQYTPAANRPPLIRHAQTWPLPATPCDDDDYSPATRIASNFLDESILDCSSPTADILPQYAPPALPARPPAYDADSWLPTDPSYMENLQYAHFDLPHLLWKQDIDADGLWFITSLRPPNGATAGRSNSSSGPSHTPNAGYFHDEDPRLAAVSAGELTERLERVECERSSGDSAYDAEQERIRQRYASWEGGVGVDEWNGMASLKRFRTAKTSHSDDVESAARIEVVDAAEEAYVAESKSKNRTVEETEAFPDYQHAEDCFMDLSFDRDATDLLLPNYAGADPGDDGYTRWPKTGCLPKSRAHRQRAASRLEDAAVQQREMRFAMQMVGASGPILA